MTDYIFDFLTFRLFMTAVIDILNFGIFRLFLLLYICFFQFILNKYLIRGLKALVYFILYICTFEIGPTWILYREFLG